MNEPIFCPSCGEEMEEWDVNLHICHACGELKNTALRVRPKCKYCSEKYTEPLMDGDNDDNHLETYFELSILGNEIILRGDVWGCVKINYCPICGRKLEDK